MEKFLIAVIMATLNTGGQFLFKASARNLPALSEVGFLNFFLMLLRSPSFYLAIALYMLGTFFWVFVLTKYHLSAVYGLLAFSYIAVPILAIIFLKEPMSPHVILGSFLVVTGIVVLALN